KKVQILLVGQPPLERLLAQADVEHLNQRIARRCRIRGMSTQDVQRYVTFRLEMGRSDRSGAGASTTPGQPLHVSDETIVPFSRAAIRTLTIVADGRPRTINLVADRALRAGFELQRRVITPAMVRAASESLDMRVPLRARWSRGVAALLVAAVAV